MSIQAASTRPSRRDAALAFLQDAVTGRMEEAYARVAPSFRHHNPAFPAGRQPLKEAMADAAAKNPDATLEVQRTLEDGDLVAVHSHVRMKKEEPGISVVHILRFEGDQVVELWDICQQVPESSPNEAGMF